MAIDVYVDYEEALIIDHRIGSKAYIGGDIEATVIEINISGKGPAYKCVWWDGKIRKTEWIDELEVNGSPKNRLRIGFVDAAKYGRDPNHELQAAKTRGTLNAQ